MTLAAVAECSPPAGATQWLRAVAAAEVAAIHVAAAKEVAALQ